MPNLNSPPQSFSFVDSNEGDWSDVDELACEELSFLKNGSSSSSSPVSSPDSTPQHLSPPSSPTSGIASPAPFVHAQAHVKIASGIKKKRTATSAEQLVILSDAFKTNRYPNQTARITLANQCSMNKDRVRIWFQNMRRKMKAVEKGPASMEV